MDLFQSMSISASGLDAQRLVMHIISMNLANANTTRTEEGGPYLRKKAILSSTPVSSRFPDLLAQKMVQEPKGVKVEAEEDPYGIKIIYDPTHPDADENGSVALPNVNMIEEMVDLLRAARSFEANVTAFNTAKQMLLRSLDIGKQ